MRAQGGVVQGAPPAYEPPVASGGGASDLNAQLLDRVSQLEEQVRQLRGRLDEIDNAASNPRRIWPSRSATFSSS